MIRSKEEDGRKEGRKERKEGKCGKEQRIKEGQNGAMC